LVAATIVGFDLILGVLQGIKYRSMLIVFTAEGCEEPQCYPVICGILVYTFVLLCSSLGVVVIGASYNYFVLLITIGLRQYTRNQHCVWCLPGLMG
jgi:hypothetical protein